MILDWRKEALPIAVLLALSSVLFGYQLGKSGLLDPDEPFYSLTAKEMVARADASTPVLFGKPQFEKPILFYWVLYASFKALGVTESAARLGPCLAGVLTVLMTYFWALMLFKRRLTAFLSSAVLATSIQFIALSRIVLTDIFLCLFVTGALTCFTWGLRDIKRRVVAWHLFFVFCALGFLTKGPLGIFIPLLGVLSFIYLGRERSLFGQFPWFSGGLLFVLIGCPWYALMTQRYGTGFLEHFFLHENVRRFFVAEHRGSDKLIFYPFVFFTGFFPWSVFLVPALIFSVRRAVQRNNVSQKTFLFLSLSLFLPFIFFIHAKSKLISYIFPMFPCAAVMTGAWMTRFYRATRLGFRPAVALRWELAAMWGVAPLGLVLGAFFYSHQNSIDVRGPLTVIAATLLPLSWLALALFWKRRYASSFISMAAGIVCLITVSFGWLLPQAGSVFSSKKWAEDYARLVRHQPDPLILASKLFIRGISYYTGDPNVAVFSDRPSGGFYTPHPIRVVSNIGELSSIHQDQFPIYCLLRQKEVRTLKEMIGPSFSVSILEGSPQRAWVRLDRG